LAIFVEAPGQDVVVGGQDEGVSDTKGHRDDSVSWWEGKGDLAGRVSVGFVTETQGTMLVGTPRIQLTVGTEED
jgi:hypothetical protein